MLAYKLTWLVSLVERSKSDAILTDQSLSYFHTFFRKLSKSSGFLVRSPANSYHLVSSPSFFEKTVWDLEQVRAWLRLPLFVKFSLFVCWSILHSLSSAGKVTFDLNRAVKVKRQLSINQEWKWCSYNNCEKIQSFIMLAYTTCKHCNQCVSFKRGKGEHI